MKSAKKTKNALGLLLGLILMLPMVSVSQSSENFLPKWIKFQNMDAVVISVPQMDTLSVRLLERKFYKDKLASNKYRFDILILEIESLTYQLDFEKDRNQDLNMIIIEKELQIKLLNEKADLLKPTFWDKAKGWLIGAGIGFFTAAALLL